MRRGRIIAPGFIAAAATAATAGFTMTQLADARRVYQRSTTSGGSEGKGAGTIPVTVAVTALGSPRFRIRSSDGSTILQAATILPAFTSTGAQTLNVTGVAARLGWFYLDLSADGVTWKVGTTLVGMGRVVAVSGQSLAVRMFQSVDDPATFAQSGASVSSYSAVYATTYSASSSDITSPSWQAPSDAGPYDSAFAASFLSLQVAAAGVNCALAGHAAGGQPISYFLPGSAGNTALRARLDEVGGFEAFVWLQGHSDAQAGTDGATYQNRLTTLFNDVTARNGERGSSYSRLVGTIPNIGSTAWGSPGQILTIRKAAATWCADNGGVYVQPEDIALQDTVHQSQAGNVTLATHFYRASAVGLGLAFSDAGPTLGAPARADRVISLTLSLPPGATSATLSGDMSGRFKVYPRDTLASPANVASVALADATLTITLASDPGHDTLLDVYALAPYDSSAANIYDNHLADGDGLNLGRHLVANTIALQVPASSTGTSNPTQLGPDLTSHGGGFAAAASGFGQAYTGGYASAPAGTVIPATNTFTVECRFRFNPGNNNLQFFFGCGNKIGVGTSQGDQNAVFFVFTDSNGNGHSLGGYNDTSGPKFSDGAWHHFAAVFDGDRTIDGEHQIVLAYIDGTQVYGGYIDITANAGTDFCLNGYDGNANYAMSRGATDEFAVWPGVRYSSNFTPATSPYTGHEGMSVLYHLNGDLNAAVAA